MKMEFDKSKGAQAVSGLMRGAKELGKKVGASTKAGVEALVEKSKADSQERRLKKYNPLFPEQYQSESFHIPNIIAIVDDAVRRDIDVCEGAIGWLDKDSGEEVLCLYDEAVEFSGIQFIPAPICNAVYYVDRFDRNRFIQADCIFSRTLKEKVDELQHIAECLGARSCLIEMVESSGNLVSNQIAVDAEISKKGARGKAAENYGGAMEYGSVNANSRMQNGRVEAKFKWFRSPQHPTLKWFAHDDGILHLVDTCCSGKRAVKEITVEVFGSTVTTMSQSVACAIDGVVGKIFSGKANVSVEKLAQKEYNSKLMFYVKF
ncbi:MAG: hypothetical protein IJB27_07075 [Clostridia bacterium]|nr:hypothetical protein [Clostridia bacterium]